MCTTKSNQPGEDSLQVSDCHISPPLSPLAGCMGELEGTTPQLDPIRYPATALLVEQGYQAPLGRPRVVSMGAVIRRAEGVITHAMRVGDHATAALIAEAFARLVVTSLNTPDFDECRLNMQEHAALRSAAVGLARSAHPAAWKQRKPTPTTDTAWIDDFDSSNSRRVTDDSTQREIDDELAALLDYSPCLEAN